MDFPCIKCGKSFSTKAGASQHLRRYCNDVDLSCKTCNKTFGTKIGISQHLRLAHPDKYNQQLEASDNRKKAVFEEAEILAIIKEEESYTGKAINLHLAALFNPSAASIKNLRRGDPYARIRGEYLRSVKSQQRQDPDSKIHDASATQSLPPMPLPFSFESSIPSPLNQTPTSIIIPETPQLESINIHPVSPLRGTFEE